MTQPAISVILPAYNAEDYVIDAINSVKQQSFQDWELICIDDGSTDSTLSIIQGQSRLDERIIALSKEHDGLSGTRNYGLNNARGKYTVFLDADDRIAAGAFARMLALINSSNSDLLLFSSTVFSDSKVNDARVKEYENYYDRHVDHLTEMPGDKALVFNIANGFVPSVPLQICKSALLKDIRFINGILFEDNPFNVRLLLDAERVSICNEKLYERRIRSGSIMNDSEPDHAFRLKSFFIITEFFRTLINEGENFSQELQEGLTSLLETFGEHALDEAYEACTNNQFPKFSLSELSPDSRSIFSAYFVPQQSLVKRRASREKDLLRLLLEEEDANRQLTTSTSYKVGLLLTAVPRKIKALLTK